MSAPEANVTELLRATASGDRRQLDALMAAIYQDLRRLAVRHMQRERNDHTLQPTALVNEAYLKLIDQRSTDWKDRVHFFAVASRIIRRILVDHARERNALKRGGDRQRQSIEDAELLAVAPGVDVIALDEALEDLAAIDAAQARIVELRYFSGLTIEEVADLLSTSPRSVDRDWKCAKAWLYCRLADPQAESRAEARRGAPDAR
jgi:RNA polymerase sigma factor (TIGR02999 family)